MYREYVGDGFSASREHPGEALGQYPVGVQEVVIARVQFAGHWQGFRGDEGGQLEVIEGVVAQVN